MTGIAVSELTTGTLNGIGVFDELMSSIDIRLAQEYSEDRIKDTEYAKVYLGSMESAITQSIQFLLGSALLTAQENKILAEIELTNAQKDKTAAELALVQQQTINAALQADVLTNQASKLAAEIALLEQKKLTEEAQINNTVNSFPVAGMIGQQKTLLEAQTNGFARKAEQDLAKICTDSWSVRRTTDENEPEPSGLTNDDITTVIDKARQGIGLASILP